MGGELACLNMTKEVLRKIPRTSDTSRRQNPSRQRVEPVPTDARAKDTPGFHTPEVDRKNCYTLLRIITNQELPVAVCAVGALELIYKMENQGEISISSLDPR